MSDEDNNSAQQPDQQEPTPQPGPVSDPSAQPVTTPVTQLAGAAMDYVQNQWNQSGQQAHDVLAAARQGNYKPLMDYSGNMALGTVGAGPEEEAGNVAKEVIQSGENKWTPINEPHPQPPSTATVLKSGDNSFVKTPEKEGFLNKPGKVLNQAQQARVEELARIKAQRGWADGGEVTPDATPQPNPDDPTNLAGITPESLQENKEYKESLVAPMRAQEADVLRHGPTIPIYDISGQQPELGKMPHEDIQTAVTSGKYSLPKGTQVPVISPNDELQQIDSEDAQEAFNNGYQYATPSMIDAKLYGGTGQQALAGAEQVAQGAFGPLATAAEMSLGVAPYAIRHREEQNPITSGVGQVAGLVGSAIAGTGEGALLGDIGKATEAFGITNKIGSAAVKGLAENAFLQAGNEVSKALTSDPTQSVGTAGIDVGLAGLLGAGIGGGIGAVNPLWQATSGTKLGQFLRKIITRTGGADGAPLVSRPIDDLLDKAGIELPPEVKAKLYDDPVLNNHFSLLSQSDTTGAGREFQETLAKSYKDIGDHMVNVLGSTPDEVAKLPDELSKYDYGKRMGKALQQQYKEQISPLSRGYENIKEKLGNAPIESSVASKSEELAPQLDKSNKNLFKATQDALKAQKSGDPEAAIEAAAKVQDAQKAIKDLHLQMKAPGTSDILIDKLNNLADKEGWSQSPSSDIMGHISRISKEIPNLKTIKGLSDYISSGVGDQMIKRDPLNGPVVRAGGLIKRIFRDEEGRLIGNHIGSEEGVDALNNYRNLQTSYAQQANLKDALDSRLHIGGSVSGYGERLGEMAQTDGETILNRLNGKNDADILNVLQQNYPKTAELVRQYHLDTVLRDAAQKAGEGQVINPYKLMTSIGKMTPEVRQFSIPQDAADKIQAVGTVLEKLKDQNHNWSNTGRTIDKIFEHLPGTATGLIAGVASHNPYAMAAVAHTVSMIGKELPAAAKLSMLKFIGSDGQVSSKGFKAMAEYFHNVIRGENLMGRVTKNIMKEGAEVLPEGARVGNQTLRDKLDAKLKQLKDNPDAMLKIGGSLGDYLPDHMSALAATSAQAVNYLNSLRPVPAAPVGIGSALPVNAVAQARYDKALNIAIQPLSVAPGIKNGQITSQDVMDLKNTHPGAYAALCAKLTNEVMEAKSKGKVIPYRTKLGMSVCMGQPLDATMTPTGIQNAQPVPPQAQPQTATQPASKPKHSTAKLGDIAKQSRTPAQQRADRAGE